MRSDRTRGEFLFGRNICGSQEPDTHNERIQLEIPGLAPAQFMVSDGRTDEWRLQTIDLRRLIAAVRLDCRKIEDAQGRRCVYNRQLTVRFLPDDPNAIVVDEFAAETTLPPLGPGVVGYIFIALATGLAAGVLYLLAILFGIPHDVVELAGRDGGVAVGITTPAV